MVDGAVNNSIPEGKNTEPSPQAQVIQTDMSNVLATEEPAKEGELQQEWSKAPLLTTEAMPSTPLHMAHKQQVDAGTGFEERKERVLPGAASRMDGVGGSVQHPQFFQAETGAARRNFTTLSDEEGSFSLGPSIEKDLVGNLLTPSNEDLRPITDGDGDARNQFSMFAGSDQYQQPIGDQELKLKKPQGKNSGPQSNILGNELASKAAAQAVEYGTESGSRQLSITEQTITLGDTEQDQMNRMFDQTHLVTTETDLDANKDDLRLKGQDADHPTDQEADGNNAPQQRIEGQESDEENTLVLASPSTDGEPNRHSTPDRLGGPSPQGNGAHLSGMSAALKPDDEESKYSGQKLDGLGISKQRSKSMKHDEPPTSANNTASGKKQKKRVPFLRLFTKRSNSREVDMVSVPQDKPQEASEKNDEEPIVDLKEKEALPSDQQPTQIATGKQKDKKGGSRFFNLFRSKKSKTKGSDVKLEQEEQQEEPAELPPQQRPPGSHDATDDLDEAFRASQEEGSGAEEEELPTKLEKADFIPKQLLQPKGRTSDHFRGNTDATEALNVVTNYNSNPDARSAADRRDSNWASDAASGGGLHSNSRTGSIFDDNPNQILSQVSQPNNGPHVQSLQKYDFWQIEQHPDDHAQGQGMGLTTIESECPFSFERTLDDNYSDTGLGRHRMYKGEDQRQDFVLVNQQLAQQPEQWSSQARMSEGNSNFGKDDRKSFPIGSQNSYNTPNSQWPTSFSGANDGEGASSNSAGDENLRSRTTGSWRGRGTGRPLMNVSVDHQKGRYSNLQPEPASNSIFVHETRSQNDTLFDHIPQFAEADERGCSADQQNAGSASSLSNHQHYNQGDHYSNTAVNHNTNNMHQVWGSAPRKTSHDLIASSPGQLGANDLLHYSTQVQGPSPHHGTMVNNFTVLPSDFNQQTPTQQPYYYNPPQVAHVQHQTATYQLEQPNATSRQSNPFQQNPEFSQPAFSNQFQPPVPYSFSDVPIGYPQQPIYPSVSRGGGRNSEPTQHHQMYPPPQFQPIHSQKQQHFVGMQMQNSQNAFFTPQQHTGVQYAPAPFNDLQSPLPQPGHQFQAQGAPTMPHTYSNPGKPPLPGLRPSLGSSGRNSTPNLQSQGVGQNPANKQPGTHQQRKSVHSEQHQHCQSCSCRASHHSSHSQEVTQSQLTGQRTPLTPFEKVKKIIMDDQLPQGPNQQQPHSFSNSGGGAPVTLKDMLGFASDFCRDQQCSRFIQEQIKGGSATEDRNAFFAEICKDEEAILKSTAFASAGSRAGDGAQPPQSLMKDVFGNFVVQMILEYGTQERIDQLFKCIYSQVPDLSFDKYGCRVVQKAFEVLPEQRQGMLISKLDQQMLVKCMYNTQGNHVIQRILTKVPHHMAYFIVELARGQVVQLCKDENGCRIVQRIMERFPRAQIKPITDQILGMITELTMHEFGNYVITHLLERGTLEEQCLVIDEIIDDIVPHSLHKFGSNVVEKCLQFAPESRKGMILDRIVGVQVANSEYSLAKMIDNEFANYVVQSAFDISDNQQRSILVQKIQQVIHSGAVNPKKGYAKHVLNKLEQRYRVSFTSQQPLHAPDFDMPTEESKGQRGGGGRHHPASGTGSRHSQSSRGSMGSSANSASGGNGGRRPQGNPSGQQHSQYAQRQYSGHGSSNDERDVGPPQDFRQSHTSDEHLPPNQPAQQRRRKHNKNSRKKP